MWRWLFALILIAALAAAAVYYFAPEKAQRLLGSTPLARQLNTTRPLYQWKDRDGRWQVSDQPPPSGTPFEVKQYPIDANVLPLSGLTKKSP